MPVVFLLFNTLALFAAVCLLTIPAGAFLGWLTVRAKVPGWRWFLWLMLAWVFVPLYLQAAAWEAGFGQQGWFQLAGHNPGSPALLHGWRGTIWVHSVAALPWVVLLVSVHLRAHSSDLESSALVDASPWRVFCRVSLAETVPAMWTSALWILATLMSEISVTDLFQIGTLAEEVYLGFALSSQATHEVPRYMMAIAGAALGATCGLWFLVRSASTLSSWDERPPAAISLGRLRWAATAVLLLIVVMIVGVPLGNLVYKAGIQVIDVAGVRHRTWSGSKAIILTCKAPWHFRTELGWTLLLTQCASLTALLIAVPLAWLSRVRRWASVLAGAIVTFSIAVSGPTLGFAVIELFHVSDTPLLEYLYSNTIIAPCLVLLGKCFPIVMLVVWVGIRSIDREALLAAELQGANSWAQLVYVVGPWKWPLLVGTWLLGVAAAMGELSGSILTVPPGVTTLAIRTFGLLHYGVEDRLAALCLASIFMVGVLLVVTWFVFRWSFESAEPTASTA